MQVDYQNVCRIVEEQRRQINDLEKRLAYVEKHTTKLPEPKGKLRDTASTGR